MSDARRTNGRSVRDAEPQPEILPALRRHWFVIFALALVGASAAFMYASAQPVVYEAQATLLLIAAGDESSPGGGRDRTLDVDTWATVARSTELLVDVADELDLDLQDVRSRSTAVASPTGDVLNLTFEAEDEDEAVEGASVYSSMFLNTRRTNVNAATVEARAQLEQLASDTELQIEGFAEQIDAEEAKGEFASDSRLTVLINAQQRATERLSEVESEIATLDVDEVTGRVLIDPSTAVSTTGLGRPVILVSGFALGALLGVVVALLRDRYDDRFGSAVAPETMGIREIARVEYYDPRVRRRVNTRPYERLATKLALTRRSEGDSGRSVLLLPVESRSVPADVAITVANALEACARSGAVSVAVWSNEGGGGRSEAFWSSARRSLGDLKDHVDLVLVPAESMDKASLGLGLSGIVDRVVLVISDNTPVRLIEEALDDISSVDVPAGDVIVLTSVRRRYL